jgi:hypothetical protein
MSLRKWLPRRLACYAIMVIAACVGTSGICTAKVACPRITSEYTADMTDLARFRQFRQWQGKRGNDLAMAVWKYLCDYETGLYHFNEILEGPDPFDEYATVRDPLKILNVYNMGYCGIFGPVLDGIFQGVGFEHGRSFGVELWNHCATEVWYDGGWHYFDLDVRGTLLDANGVAVSLDQARRDRNLWTDPQVKVEPFFPKDQDKDKVFEIYRDSGIDYYYRWFQGSHTMDFYLRQGETFTRWWQPQGGFWHHLPRYNSTKWVKDLLLTSPVGMKPNHRDFTRWNHGNGVFYYAPSLSNNSTDFQDGFYAVENLAPGKEGLHVVKEGEAEVIFEVFTPYIIAAKVNDLDDARDDAEASVVTLDAMLPVELFVSLDHGLSWQSAGRVKAGEDAIVDLTRMVKGAYGYLLKLATAGTAGAAAIKSLEIYTWVQVAPISLPRLKKGDNHLRYEIGDRYGLATVPILVNPNTAAPNDLAKYLVAMPQDYDPQRETCRIRGEAVLRLAAPQGTKIAWCSVGATFRTYQGEQASQTDNRIAYAVGEPKDFKEIYKSSVPTWVNHWRYNWDTDIRLDVPAEKVYIKYTGQPGLDTIRACMHVIPEQPQQTQIRITHGYKVDGQLRQETIDLDGPATYTVRCDEEPENVFIKVGVPSS